ncbi:MAG: hypothetical protein A4E28_00555 [Methanocella sp. PtaU1.Bin125]|nr:MAG: hypothetical protein A4E28_00555 [Methanocella sp. PtaU1.Bin125]
MEKKLIESGKGLSGMLKMFKSTMQGLNLQHNSKIVFIGNPGTCVPFIELFAYTIRELVQGMVYVPDGLLDDARSIWRVDGVGMQIGGATDPYNADYVILLGGLSMPGSKVSTDACSDIVKKILKPGGKVIGVCFMDMFAKAGWEDKVCFDLIMNADISSVTVSKFE